MSMQTNDADNSYLIKANIKNDFDLDRVNFQQLMNHKNKYDNRMYYSLRYKRYPSYTTEEPFTGRYNVWSPLVAMVIALLN